MVTEAKVVEGALKGCQTKLPLGSLTCSPPILNGGGEIKGLSRLFHSA
jgi:hypothetical protein